MTSAIWKVFDAVADLSAKGNKDDAELIGRLLNAAMETVSDVLPSADGHLLSEGAMVAARALAHIQSNGTEPINRQSADFLAGRLAAVIDILGYAAARTAYADDVETAMQEPYAAIIRKLGSGMPQTTVELASSFPDIHYVVMREYLGQLAKMGMAQHMYHGQKICPALTPAGTMVAEALAKGTSAEDLLAGTLR
jgi:hypothetical protein